MLNSFFSVTERFWRREHLYRRLMEQDSHLRNIYYEILQDISKDPEPVKNHTALIPLAKIKDEQVHPKCHLCSFSPSEAAKLPIHMRTHTGVKPYSCNQCKFKTSTDGNLRVHMRSHSGEKPYTCILCNFSSTTKGKITLHMKSHNEDRPQKCNQCNFSTTEESYQDT